jgi:hypothetical protein
MQNAVRSLDAVYDRIAIGIPEAQRSTADAFILGSF